MIKNIIRALTVVLVASFLIGSAVLAQVRNQDITLTPTSVNEVVVPDSINEGTFQLFNQGTTDYNFKVYAAPYHVTGEEYTPDFTPLPGAPDVKSWFKFSISDGHLKAGQSAAIKYTITVPANTLPGGYYAVAFAETLSPQTNEAGVMLNQRVGELFYLRVDGPATEAGRVVEWGAGFWQKPPVTALLRMENSGSVHYEAELQLKVDDLFGRNKYSFDTKKIILPQTIRKISLPWEGSSSFGLFKVTATAKYLGKTETLPTKYVLVMSQKVRVIVLAIIAVLILLVVVRYIKHARFSKNKKSKKH